MRLGTPGLHSTYESLKSLRNECGAAPPRRPSRPVVGRVALADPRLKRSGEGPSLGRSRRDKYASRGCNPRGFLVRIRPRSMSRSSAPSAAAGSAWTKQSSSGGGTGRTERVTCCRTAWTAQSGSLGAGERGARGCTWQDTSPLSWGSRGVVSGRSLDRGIHPTPPDPTRPVSHPGFDGASFVRRS